jgi:cyclohexanone monooxygenase
LFQRTPQWILPKPDTALGLLPRTLLRVPGATDVMRGVIHRQLERLGVAFRHPEHMKRVQAAAELHLRRSVKDPELRRKLTPNYVLGCKRMLLSNDYYPAVTRSNVEVLATGVREIRGRSVVGQDGEIRDVDTVILGTGFHVTDPPMANQVRGTDGRSLAEVWGGSPEAYRGTTVAGFPNSFGVLGPNLAIGHNSAFLVIEAQLAYILDALRVAREDDLSRIEVRRDAQAAYNRRIQRGLETTVWNTGGCASYYIDANGRNSVAFPWSTDRMRALLARFDVENYHVMDDRPRMVRPRAAEQVAQDG